MAQSHGFHNTVVVGSEATYGTASDTYNWIGIVDSFEPEEAMNVDTRRSVGVRGPFMLRYGQSDVSASLSVTAQNGRLLAYALGIVSSAEVMDGTTATGNYTHEIRPVRSGEELPSFTVQNHNPEVGLTRNYVGNKIDSLTVSASAEEAVTFETDIQTSHVEDTGITPATVSAELDNYFMFYESAVSINSVDVANVTEFELEVANNLEKRFVLNGSNRPARITEGSLEVTASVTLDFVDTTQWDAFMAGDEISMTLRLVDSDNPDHTMEFRLTGGLYDTNSLSVGAEDLQEQDLDVVFKDIAITVVDQKATLI